MKNKIEILVPKAINELSLKALAKTIKAPNKDMKQYENRMEQKAYEACKRETSIKLHKRLYWRSNKPMWPLYVESESLDAKRREKILTRIEKDLKKAGYSTEWREEHLNRPNLTLLITGIKK